MEELKLQITQMKTALGAASHEDKPGLQMMIDQLEQLLHESTSHEENSISFNNNSENVADEDEEFRRFQEEISALDNSNEGNITTDSIDGTSLTVFGTDAAESTENEVEQNDDLNDELSALEGMKCKAPFEHHWGQLGYYNAVVFNVESSNCESLDTILVRVVFSQPVVESMKPCPYFMEGKCRYDDDACKFSHGEVVSLAQLKEYSEPDFGKIVTGSRVLAKYSDGLWYKGTVSEITEEGECHLTYDSYTDTHTIPLHETCPLYDDADDDDDQSTSDSSNSSASSEDEEEFVRMIQTSDSAFLDMKATGALGEWEKHTKGIGSKLMERMGYVVGTGLGRRGDGRVEPVDAVVLPRGRSLDTCMHLKEKAGRQNIFSAEKTLQRHQRKEAQRAKKEEEKSRQAESIFNFLNTKLSLSKDKGALKKVNIRELNKDTCKNLNKKMLDLGENMKQVTKDIAKLKDGIKRHEGRDHKTAEKMKTKLEHLEKHLEHLKKSEFSIASEQQQRSDKKKLSIF